MANDPAPSFESILHGANRKYGANTIGVSDNLKALEISRIPTGIATLDNALGGGFPMGQIAELYGRPSSGKSLISLLTIKQAQQRGLNCVYFDIENSYDPVWAKGLGVDTDKLVISQMSIGEDIVDLTCKLLDAKPGVIVIDSVAAIATRAEMEGEADQKYMAPLARLLSYGLKRITHHNTDTVIIFVNQLRSAISLYGPTTYTPGGNALPHAASIRMEVKKDSQLITASGKKLDQDIIGQIVDFKVVKNKTAAPHKFGSFRYLYDGYRIEE